MCKKCVKNRINECFSEAGSSLVFRFFGDVFTLISHIISVLCNLISLCLLLLCPSSTLETTFDGSVTTDISSSAGSNSSAGSRSILSLTSSRPSLSSWRLGQSSPRLQAGDAPSLGNSYSSRVAGGQGGRYMYPGHLRRQLAGRGGALSVDLGDRSGDDIDLDGISMEVTGYMSDGDVLNKNAARNDDVTSG